MTDPSASMIFGQTIITIPEQLAEANRKVLIYFAQILEIPEISEETIFTAEELETLESIAEEIESFVPNIIDEVYVNMESQSMEIKEIIDIRLDERYYWFHVPYADRDHQLRKFIGDYHHKSRAGIVNRKASERKLRNDKIARI